MLGQCYTVNPVTLIGYAERETVRLFYASEASGVLPQAGGWYEQASLMIDAFDYCRRVQAAIRAEHEILDGRQQLARFIIEALGR